MCDFVLASDNAVFSPLEIEIGQMPFATSLPYLAKMVGKHRAMDMAINARRITAQEAFDLGLVNKVTTQEELMPETRALAEEICSRPPITVAAIKQVINKSMNTMEHYELERAWGYFLGTTEDNQRAREAWAKREPRPPFEAN